MSRKILGCILAGIFSLGLAGFAEEAPHARQRSENLAADLLEPRAIVQIKSEAGTCYWRVAGDDDLVRLPVQDERFASILLSARFDQDQLHLSVAGEHAPLDTSSLGQFDLGLKDETPVMVNSFRAVKSRQDGTPAAGGGWEIRVLRPHTKVDTTNCCSCGLVKLSCCPNKNYCIGCGVCGNCCG
jgi:hypothetical protein